MTLVGGLPGAILLALGIEAVHLFTIYWIARQITRKSELYGGIGGSLAILLWAYVIGRLIIAASVINSLLWARHEASRLTDTSTQVVPGNGPIDHHGG